MKLITKPESSFSPYHVANSVNEFKFHPEEGTAFNAYYQRFRKRMPRLDGRNESAYYSKETGTIEHEKYCEFVLLKKVSGINSREKQ